MTSTLVIKLGATGDVVRTTPLLSQLQGQITWVTAAKNTVLLQGLKPALRCLSWEERAQALDCSYDLILNLEDAVEVAEFAQKIGKATTIVGAYLDSAGELKYTDNSKSWFDLSLISAYGRKEADRRKLLNRRTYQDMIFEALEFKFSGEKYLLPSPIKTSLSGDVAVAAEAGPVWPMKNWAYFETIIKELREEGLTVNILPQRACLLEHLGDVSNHRCLVGGDSLPMHFALGARTRCVSLFTCTSPWEIYDYGIQTKINSPLLEEFFYQRGYDRRATTAISVEEVREAVHAQLAAASKAGSSSLEVAR